MTCTKRNTRMSLPQAVLFDLDGTLIDTAPDLAQALNHVLQQQDRTPLPFAQIRPVVSYGALGLIKLGFNRQPGDPEFTALRTELLAYYAQHLSTHSRVFSGIHLVLQHLEVVQIPWGVVTNKPGYLTRPLLAALALDTRAAVIVSGDTCAQSKPHPAPILYACQQLQINPRHAWYIGDADRDITAGRAAGNTTIGAAYGYIHPDESVADWAADHIIQKPLELLRLLDHTV